MLLAGDEHGHSQGGNNNAYCQDNETTWLDWAHMDTTLLAFTRRLIAMRRTYPSLRRTAWLAGEHNGNGDKDVTWINRRGQERTVEQWEDPNNQCLGIRLAPVGDEPLLLVLINGEADAIDYTLPEGRWTLLLDTARVDAPDDESAIAAPSYMLAERSLALFRQMKSVSTIR